VLAAAGVALFLAHAWWFRAFVIDDAYITFRYARNIAAGLGPVFNPGERVEGFSNPLLTALLAVITAITRDPETLPRIARVIGVASGAGTVLLLARLPLRGGTGASALATLALAASSSFALWSVAGLETSLYALVLLASLALSLSPPRGAAGQIGHGLLLAAVALSRPEGVVPAAVLAIAFARGPATARDPAHRPRVLLAAALPVIAYLVFRRTWYGAWLPNTYFAKHLPLTMAIPRGLKYLADFLLRDGRGLAFAPALLALAPGARSRVGTLALVLLAAYLPTVLFVGGDWMDLHRFVAPVVPLLAILLAEGASALIERLRGAGGGARRWAGPAIVTALALAMIVPETRASVRERGRYWVNAAPYYTTMGRLVAAVSDPGWSVAVADVGAIGWYGRIRVVDLLGLVNPAIAHGQLWAEPVVAASPSELIVLHYDDRDPPQSRWRPLRLRGFDEAWVAPHASVPLPGSLRVRVDVRDSVQARLARLAPGLREALVRLDAELALRQPDGLPIAPVAAR
jgi:hypothetical protein